jgi:hypothetical protein
MTHPLHKVGLQAHRTVMRPFHRRPRLIALFSVMRSGTTLLTRILADNPQIAGFGEAHIQYNGPDDLLDLKYWIFRFTRRYPRQGMYLLDKILHGKHVPDLGQLEEMTDLYPVFLIREPVANVRSLSRMFGDTNGSAGLPWDSLLGRYAELEAHLATVRGRHPIAALSYEKLTEAPESVLAELTRHLGLSHPLQARYAVPSYVGKWGLGDGGANIRAGSIVPRERRETTGTEADPLLPPPEVAQAYRVLSEHLRDASACACL